MTDYGTTGREYDAAYPRGSRRQQWIDELIGFVRDGGTLTRYEADSLDREGMPVYRMFGGYANPLPGGWQSQEVRAFNS